MLYFSDIPSVEGDLNKVVSQHSLNEEKFQKLTEQVVTLVKNYDGLVSDNNEMLKVQVQHSKFVG